MNIHILISLRRVAVMNKVIGYDAHAEVRKQLEKARHDHDLHVANISQSFKDEIKRLQKQIIVRSRVE